MYLESFVGQELVGCLHEYQHIFKSVNLGEHQIQF